MKRRVTKVLISLTLAAGIAIQGAIPVFAIDGDHAAAISAVHLKTEYQTNPMGIDMDAPTLSWEVDSQARAQVQSAYQIKVADESGDIVWDSGKVESNETTGIEYEGEELSPMQKYTWNVRVWDKDNAVSDWSEQASWETGLTEEQWKDADWIGKASSVSSPESLNLEESNWIWVLNGTDYKYVPGETRYFRKTIAPNTEKSVQKVLLAFSGDDYGTVYVNGTQAAAIEGANAWRKGDAVDITNLFTAGQNQISAEITNASKGYAGFIAKVIIRYNDGTNDIFVTDESWKSSLTPEEGWMLPTYDDSSWEIPDQVLTYGVDPWKKQVNLPQIEDDNSKVFDAAPMLRKEFSVQDKKVKSARAYITGLGYYELTLNGERVGDNMIDPLVTRYNQRYFYTTYDVTDQLLASENTIGVTLGRGYYGTIGNGMNWQTNGWSKAPWADQPKLRMKLCIEFENGETMQVVSDESWKTHDSATIFDEPYYGEVYDARLEIPDWDKPGFDDSQWEQAVLMEAPTGTVEPQAADANKVVDEVHPVSITNPKEGVYVFDMGRVVTGWAELNVQGNAGDMVTIQYGETLTEEGTLNRKDLVNDWDVDGFVKQASSDYYILKGGEEETWQPRFTYKGYQYIQVSGYPGVPTLDSITGKVINADLEETGEFSSSNEMFNKIHEIGKATLLNNLHSYPSDTPVYENLGYLGDGHLTQEMGMYNFDMVRYYEKWANDIRDQSKENGYMEQTAPMWNETKDNAPEWSAAICLVPWQNYQISGNKRTLADNYQTMKTVFGYQRSLMKDNIADSMWGDHANVSGNRITPITATAYVYYMADIIAKSAEVLGYTDDIDYYTQEAETIKEAFHNKFYDEEQGFYCLNKGGTFYQTAQALPLALGMVPEEVIPRVVYEFSSRSSKMESGIFGIKYVFAELTEAGYGDIAYNMVNTEEYPGFGYWLSKGATSMWEGWTEGTRSRDHHMFATIDDWFYETIAGINYEGAGFSTSVIKPYAVGDLTNAQASLHTVRGKLSSAWSRAEDGTFSLNIEIPANTTATVYVPTADQNTVFESGIAADKAEGVSFLRMDNGFAVYSVGSGRYSFTSKYAAPEPIGKPGEEDKHTYVVDEFGDYNSMFTDSTGLRFDTANTDKYFFGDGTRICRTSLSEKEIVYYLSDDIKSINLVTFTGKNSDWKNDFAFSVSSDNSTYVPLEIQDATREGNTSWVRITYQFDQIPEGMRFFKIQFKPMTGNAWEPQLAKLTVDCGVENPQFLTVDKRVLQKAFDEASLIDLSIYTEETANQLKAALEQADKVLQNTSATQQMIDDAVEALQQAVDGLIEKPQNVDKSILNAVITYAENAKASGEYDNAIESVQKSFDAALENAKTVAANAGATQAEVDVVWRTLLNEIHKLGFVAGDKTSLTSLIKLANGINAKLDLYVEAGKPEFTAALEAAVAVYEDGDAMQAEINIVADNLLNAMLNLRLKADKTILQQVIAEANGKDANAYTAKSYGALQAAVAKANEVMADENATQDEVDVAVTNVQTAMDNLVVVDGTSAETPTEDVVQTGQESTTAKANAAKTGDVAPIAGLAVITLAGTALLISRKRK